MGAGPQNVRIGLFIIADKRKNVIRSLRRVQGLAGSSYMGRQDGRGFWNIDYFGFSTFNRGNKFLARCSDRQRGVDL